MVDIVKQIAADKNQSKLSLLLSVTMQIEKRCHYQQESKKSK